MYAKSCVLIIMDCDSSGKYVVETFLVSKFLLNLSFLSLDVLWVSPSLPVSLLESCSSPTALLWVNLPVPFDAEMVMVMVMVIIITTHTVTQAVEDIRLEMVQAWVLVC